jgi:DNA-binding response OmpR family regulator
MTNLLLIEDDSAVASSLREGLTQEGYRVQWRNTGADGAVVRQNCGMRKAVNSSLTL